MNELTTATDNALTEVSKGDARKLDSAASKLWKANCKGLRLAVEQGRTLQDAQKLLANYSDGCYVAWLEADTPLSVASAYNRIDVAILFADWDLRDIEKLRITATGAVALSKLARKDPEAADPLVEAMGKGERITKADVEAVANPPQAELLPAPDSPADVADAPDVSTDAPEAGSPADAASGDDAADLTGWMGDTGSGVAVDLSPADQIAQTLADDAACLLNALQHFTPDVAAEADPDRVRALGDVLASLLDSAEPRIKEFQTTVFEAQLAAESEADAEANGEAPADQLDAKPCKKCGCDFIPAKPRTRLCDDCKSTKSKAADAAAALASEAVDIQAAFNAV